MTAFTVLLDAPAKPTSRIQIAKLGEFTDPRWGEFSITAENVASWQSNLSKLPGGEALIDFEHRSERKPRDSQAAGWITSVDLDGDKVMADARWTPEGEQAIRDERYRFTSPVFGPTLGADNEKLDDALPSVALTNKPVLGMPAVMLASQERLDAAMEELEPDADVQLLDPVTTDPQPEPSADSRRAMDAEHTTALLKTLDLPDDADDAKIVEKIEKLQRKAAKQADQQPNAKTLDQLAADAGKRVLDSESFQKLLLDAQQGAEAKAELHEQKFEHGFAAAVQARKVTPAEKDSLHHFFTLDADATLSMLEAREPIMLEKPLGAPAIDFSGTGADIDEAQVLATGIDPNSLSEHQRIQRYMLDNKLPPSQYARVLEQYVNGEVSL